MAQSSDQLLHWVTSALPALHARLARTHAAIGRTRRQLEQHQSRAE
jgi:hypothetical protein